MVLRARVMLGDAAFQQQRRQIDTAEVQKSVHHYILTLCKPYCLVRFTRHVLVPEEEAPYRSGSIYSASLEDWLYRGGLFFQQCSATPPSSGSKLAQPRSPVGTLTRWKHLMEYHPALLETVFIWWFLSSLEGGPCGINGRKSAAAAGC